jgi:hypothetical protein
MRWRSGMLPRLLLIGIEVGRMGRMARIFRFNHVA